MAAKEQCAEVKAEAEKKTDDTAERLEENGSGNVRTTASKKSPAMKRESKRFLCEVCGFSFVRRHLSSHRARHSEVKPFQCSLCSKRFYTNRELKKHEQYHNKEGLFICSLCGKRFYESQNLQYHMQHKHCATPDETPRHQCESCDKSFTSRSSLLVHAQKHNEIHGKQCKICGLKFTERRAQLRHMNKHADGTKKMVPAHLVKQMKIDVAKQEYMCGICHKKFTGSNYLTMHMKKHIKKAGRRPTKSMKPEESTSESAVSVLVEDHQLYLCHICKKVLSSQNTLNWHIERAHNIVTALSNQ